MLRTLLLVIPMVLALSTIGAEAKPKPDKPKSDNTAIIHAPEFDTKTAGAALAVLVGGVLVIAERRRRKARQH